MHASDQFYPYAIIDFTVKYYIKRGGMPRLHIAYYVWHIILYTIMIIRAWIGVVVYTLT